MATQTQLVAVICFGLCSFFMGTKVQAESYSYGQYENGKWITHYGEVPAPPTLYTTPTADPGLNENDKLFLCSLVRLTAIECAAIQFTTGAAAFNAHPDVAQPGVPESVVTQFGFDVSMNSNGKECSGSIWKTRQADGTWKLSSPSGLSGFPSTCDIP